MNLQDILNSEFGKRNIQRTAVPDEIIKNLNPSKLLRPYQEECFRYFLTYWENSFEQKESKPQLLFHMATGSGNTLIMAGLILYLYEKGYRNFLFFVNNSNIIEKSRDNFLNKSSIKYLFAPIIEFKGQKVLVKEVDNFQNVDENNINLCLTTIQGLHDSLNIPHENSITYDDFKDKKIIMISDEAHHMNAATKKGKPSAADASLFLGEDEAGSDNWETTVMNIFHADKSNALFEFTATEDFQDPSIAKKYENKVLFDYPLKKFRADRYSKDIEVIQSDLPPIERALQAVILSQYKRKLFVSIGQDIKPVMMLKSKTIPENSAFMAKFVSAVKSLTEETIRRIRERAVGDIADAFSYFDEKGIKTENLLLELKEDFKEDNLLLVDGKNISPEKQIILNSLESRENEYRVIFAVDMLNEGWDVLNLFDIVRMYDKRDSKDGKVGKTTMQEAQLIGRGARYMPFTVNYDQTLPADMRKFDNDVLNRLRVIEKLHYHSASNPKYISELRQAMVQTGIVAERTQEIYLKLKESFKATALYNKGYVFGNKREPYLILEGTDNIGRDILDRVFKVRLYSGMTQTSIILDAKENFVAVDNSKTITFTLKELGHNVVRAAINRLNAYSFGRLREIMPSLSSIDELIRSPKYLADINVELTGGCDALENLTQNQKLSIALEVLMQIVPMMRKSIHGYRGTKEFVPVDMVKNVFKDKVIKLNFDGSENKELGRPMSESALFPGTDLSKCDWYAYEECYGTSEEKYFVKYFEGIVPKLKEKYESVYLVRNEREMKIYEFEGGIDGGRACEPDYFVFLKKKDEHGYENIQLFVEPKGKHLKEHDEWKQDFLEGINSDASVDFTLADGSTFSVKGLPFYIEEQKTTFDRAVGDLLGVSAW